jgi:uncharacterized protein (TIGR02596 family)
MRTQTSKNSAFSLLELLAVILIIGIIVAFTTPAVGTLLKGSQMSQAEQIIVDQLRLARQEALIRNHNVQVRWIRFGDPDNPGEKAGDPTTGYVRAIQLMEVLENGAVVPIDKPALLPQAVIVDRGPISTLVNDPSLSQPIQAKASRSADGSGGDPAMPKGVDYNYDYVTFRYRPDGSTTLSTTSGTIWCITLRNWNDPSNGTTPPANFVTVQVDPVSGTLRIFRPSV